MSPHTCLPDEFLSEAHLNALYNTFSASLRAQDSDATVFSSVVNNVRHAYITALLRARSDDLERLRRELDPLPRRPAPGGVGDTPDPPAASPAIAPSWPAKTFTLHIGSYDAEHRRDMPGWVNMDRDGWTERTAFEVFKFEEPGTVRVDVTERLDPHCMVVNRPQPGWNRRMTFYAYAQHRPGTVWVGVLLQTDPHRCVFVRGNGGEGLQGWERIMEFWVPV